MNLKDEVGMGGRNGTQTTFVTRALLSMSRTGLVRHMQSPQYIRRFLE